MKTLINLLLFLLISTNLLKSQTVESIPNPKASNVHTYVSNPDYILSEQIVNELNTLLDKLEEKTEAEVAVVVVNSIGDNEIKSFAIELFEYWGIGKSDMDNGVLVLFVEDQRKITFEVGYGLEGTLPDAICKRIQTNKMLPYFKEQNYDEGILTGVDEIASIISGEPISYDSSYKKDPINIILSITNSIVSVFKPYIWLYITLLILSFIFIIKAGYKVNKDESLSPPAKGIVLKKNNGFIVAMMTFFIPFVGIFVIAFWMESRHFISLILIPFLSIPAYFYSKWRIRMIKNRSVCCTLCEHKMLLLSNKEDKKYLSNSQELEVKLNSVRYDVYFCKSCSNTKIYKLNRGVKYSDCPKCKNRTYSVVKSIILRRATYSNTGLRRITYLCQYCNHKGTIEEVIPVETSSSDSSGSSSGGGGSSSSSSGGSFGGGSSGGGGSTSSW